LDHTYGEICRFVVDSFAEVIREAKFKVVDSGKRMQTEPKPGTLYVGMGGRSVEVYVRKAGKVSMYVQVSMARRKWGGAC